MEEIDFKNVISAAELVRLQWRPHGWLLWQMVPQGGITLLAGETASGKSFLGLDLALGMASGRGKAWDMDLGETEESAQPLILSPLLGEGRRSRGEGKVEPEYPSSTASGPHLPLIPSHRARRVSRALLRGDLAFDTNNGDLTVKPRARSGDRHDQGLPSFPSALLRGSSTTASDESLSPLLGEGRRSRGEGKVEPEYPSSTASCGSLSPLLGEGRRSRGEGKLCTPTTPSFPSALLRGSSTTASGPHLPLIPSSRAPLRGDLAFNTNNGDLALGVASGRGKAWDMELGEEIADSLSLAADSKRCLPNNPVDGTNTLEQTMPVPYNVQLKDPSQAQDDNPRRVRYFCGDADPNLVAERVLRLCRGYPNGKNAMGIDVPEALDLDFSLHAFSDPESFAWLQKEVIRQRYQLLIFDGLAQYLPGMADGSASAVGAFLRGLRQLTSQTGVSVVLLHQFNKRLASRLNKWGIPTSQGEERVRGSSELLAGVDSVLLLSRPEAMKLGGMGRTVLKVVKNRLGQAGARLQFTIVDGDASLHLLFERLGAQAQPKPRRLVDAAFDEMMRILMTEDERKFDRTELTKLLQERMNLPSTRMLKETFSILGKDERVRVERDESGKKRYSWAQPGTGALERKVYGLPPAMALDVASSYLLSKARLNLAEQQMEAMQAKGKTTELLGQLAVLLKGDDEGDNLTPS